MTVEWRLLPRPRLERFKPVQRVHAGHERRSETVRHHVADESLDLLRELLRRLVNQQAGFCRRRNVLRAKISPPPRSPYEMRTVTPSSDWAQQPGNLTQEVD